MEKLRSRKSLIVSALAVLVVLVVTAVFGDYFYDLNDDVLMKDILSGAYTGTPGDNSPQISKDDYILLIKLLVVRVVNLWLSKLMLVCLKLSSMYNTGNCI